MASQRSSNIELLRIICMLMILIQHADFWLLGYPSDRTFSAFCSCLLESASLVAVNVFVLISGYFGMRYRTLKIIDILFQCLFCTVIISLVAVISGYSSIGSVKDFYRFFSPFNYWFVTAYIGLIILAPILNAFINNSNSWQLAVMIFLLIVAAIIFDLCFQETSGMAFVGGYSTIWFINLYLIGRYIKIYGIRFCSGNNAILWYFLYVIVFALLLFFHVTSTRYTNPLYLIGSVSLLMIFIRLNFCSQAVNWIASSSLMVYLFGMHPVVIQIFGHYLHLFKGNNGLVCFVLLATSLIIAIFVIAILFDKIRLLVWRCVEPIAVWIISKVSGLFELAYHKL